MEGEMEYQGEKETEKADRERENERRGEILAGGRGSLNLFSFKTGEVLNFLRAF